MMGHRQRHETKERGAPHVATCQPVLAAAAYALLRSAVLGLLAAQLVACGGPNADGGGDGDDDGVNDAPRVPELDPVSLADARALAAYARRLQVKTIAGGVPRPSAWSMVNVSCQDRTVALEYSLALAAADAPSELPLLDEGDLTETRFRELQHAGKRLVAAINITGPLVTSQTLVLPNGTELSEDRLSQYYWPYHHGVVLNVDGELRVLDLSVGDEPIPIDEWAHGFVTASVECSHMPEQQYVRVWSYWVFAFGNLIPAQRPAQICGYTLTPIFAPRWDLEPTAATVTAVAPAMEVQLGSFKTTLAGYDVTLPEEQIPQVLSRYEALTEADVCSWLDFTYCNEP